MVELGQKVRDKITGLEGIAVGRHEYLYGCVRISVQPVELHDGKLVESIPLDEPQLDVIDTSKIGASPTTGPGGPRSGPGPRPVPSSR